MKEYRMSQPKLFEKLIQVFGSISAISGKKILVIRDLEVALMLSVRNAVVYITDDEECSEAFRKNTEAGMGNDDVVLFINKWTNKLKFTKVFEKMGMKFDVAIMNPPYDRNLHLKILEAVIPHAEKVVNISPVRWLQDPFAPYLTRSDYCKFENSISKHIKDLEVISAKNATELFQEASFTMNLGIYTCDSEGGWNYRHDDPLVNKIVTKTMENSWAPYNFKRLTAGEKAYSINIAGIHSATAKYAFVCNTYEAQLKTGMPKDFNGGRNGAHFSFDTEEERRNFYDCYTQPFMQWHASLWKSDVNMNTFKIPYFGDYKTPWTNEKFKAYFELTDDEWARSEREMLKMNQ